MIKKAVIPIAGYGIRCLPFSKAIPKTMINVVSTPVIQLIVDEFVKSGITEILFIEGSTGQIVQDHFSRNFELEDYLLKIKADVKLQELKNIHNMANFYFLTAKEIKGSGSSILMAKEWVGNEPFFVACGDEFFVSEVPVVKQLLDVYEKTGKAVIATKTIEDNERCLYGILEGEINDKILTITKTVEKPKIEETSSNYAGMGRYLLTSDIFEYLEKIKNPLKGEVQLTDAIQMKISEKHDVLGLIYDGKRYDCGNKFDYIVASIEMALKDESFNHKLKKYLVDLTNKEDFVEYK